MLLGVVRSRDFWRCRRDNSITGVAAAVQVVCVFPTRELQLPTRACRHVACAHDMRLSSMTAEEHVLLFPPKMMGKWGPPIPPAPLLLPANSFHFSLSRHFAPLLLAFFGAPLLCLLHLHSPLRLRASTVTVIVLVW